MEHPLQMDAEAMRRAGYATVDALVARLADPGADPVLRRPARRRCAPGSAARPPSRRPVTTRCSRGSSSTCSHAALTGKGRALLSGIDRADSVTLDPHKWLFQPMECGSVLIRDGARLERTFAIHPDYLDGNAALGGGEVNFADRGLQLSRGFRALKVWVSVHTFGLAAFRAAIQRGLELAEFAEALISSHAGLTLMAPATLGIVCSGGSGPAATRPRRNASGWASSATWNAAAPRSCPAPGCAAARRPGSACSTRPARRTTYGG